MRGRVLYDYVSPYMFTVKYRSQKGAIVEVSIKASNRAECASICKSRGITAISISEKRVSKKTCRDYAYFKIAGKTVAMIVLLSIGYLIFTYEVPPVMNESKRIRHEKLSKDQRTNFTNLDAKVVSNDKIEKSTISPKKEYPTYVDDNGILRHKNGMRVRTDEPARSFTVGGLAKKRFKFVSEEQIAGLLEIEPGTMVFGRMTYGDKFIEDFKKSLEEEIEFLETDSEYDRKLKEDVIETKKELKAAFDRGEDIGKMLTETRNQLQELGQYREKLKRQFSEYRREGPKTAHELKDFVDAINVMLAESGARPIKLSRLLLRKIEKKGGTK